ncbi:hypothetical protein CHI12_00065 [Terribacillus saccharophilus]|jgi:uncharacterized protein YycO|uniref:Permuted papain-like amidase enzyme, YaeF/YiiX, C92 family n=1 Tax=Terribacillus saccharophilus TaxID=361277 RepID=A0A268HI96_9BACI|nr:hypothetical protein [Terribacillus saccharophilus]PAE09606.1 hypothetical protein CHI12_00065 [Terribacillus saccharophilus]
MRKSKAEFEKLFQTASTIQKLLQAGDVLYSSIGPSTYFFSHAGIVGSDGRIFHAHPSGGITESLRSYLSRHHHGGTITLLRPKIDPSGAAEWAERSISLMKGYRFSRALADPAWNYCTKFVWQAFWSGARTDLTSARKQLSRRWIFPRHIKHSAHFEPIAKFSLEYRL